MLLFYTLSFHDFFIDFPSKMTETNSKCELCSKLLPVEEYQKIKTSQKRSKNRLRPVTANTLATRLICDSCKSGNKNIGCELCGKILEEKKSCGDCQRVWYCSNECQIKDLPLHQLICAKNTQISSFLKKERLMKLLDKIKNDLKQASTDLAYQNSRRIHGNCKRCGNCKDESIELENKKKELKLLIDEKKRELNRIRIYIENKELKKPTPVVEEELPKPVVKEELPKPVVEEELPKPVVKRTGTSYCDFCWKKLVDPENSGGCEECWKVKYCSGKCQLDDWPLHKLLCKSIHKSVVEQIGIQLQLWLIEKEDLPPMLDPEFIEKEEPPVKLVFGEKTIVSDKKDSKNREKTICELMAEFEKQKCTIEKFIDKTKKVRRHATSFVQYYDIQMYVFKSRLLGAITNVYKTPLEPKLTSEELENIYERKQKICENLQEINPVVKLHEICICGKTNTMMCVKCKLKRYCCPDCQVCDWPSHKRVCRKGSKILLKNVCGSRFIWKRMIQHDSSLLLNWWNKDKCDNSDIPKNANWQRNYDVISELAWLLKFTNEILCVYYDPENVYHDKILGQKVVQRYVFFNTGHYLRLPTLADDEYYVNICCFPIGASLIIKEKLFKQDTWSFGSCLLSYDRIKQCLAEGQKYSNWLCSFDRQIVFPI